VDPLGEVSLVSQADPIPATVQHPDPRAAFSYTAPENLIEILDRIGGSLLISTYQAGRLVAIGVARGRLTLSLHAYDQVMGVAVAPERIAVGSSSQVWLLQSHHEIARRLEPPGQHDGCFVTRLSHVTGEIRIHELAWVGRELWFVNTMFSCLCSLDPAHSFLPRWRPHFISSSAPGDRCHLNGLAVAGGVPRYATALAETDALDGWREHKASGGCLIDVPRNATVARDFSMPHSPRVHDGRVWLLDSGKGRLVIVDPGTGTSQAVAELPGYPRGLAFAGPYAFVGLSRIREGRGLYGMPLEPRRHELKSGLAVVELASGNVVSVLEFTAGIHETFDVQVLPGIRCPAFGGPFPSKDGGQPMWIVPEAWMPGPDAMRMFQAR
jgi:uncharacterized protein (TIGR03032 family)